MVRSPSVNIWTSQLAGTEERGGFVGDARCLRKKMRCDVMDARCKRASGEENRWFSTRKMLSVVAGEDA
jgi:hypothetical protein